MYKVHPPACKLGCRRWRQCEEHAVPAEKAVMNEESVRASAWIARARRLSKAREAGAPLAGCSCPRRAQAT